ncbi:NF-kappa-B inhibitor beta [Latimeria chalumnae]|uniref:NFKB inhibitor beta n=1 Tax=Latimeria chalumnae TaxID=7897 RepID=H3BG07_LATCH|nr:PREDICTED: NF-kappa-B inhibitor beta [Latimeria chalumnae]|eukprot:XP_005987930.1 PREDICTED: NF-kappa-B inhibitor beta [Latimeria chalumnae]
MANQEKQVKGSCLPWGVSAGWEGRQKGDAEAGSEEWCDSGLDSLGDAQSWPAWKILEPEARETLAEEEERLDSGVVRSTAELQEMELCQSLTERLDSAIGESIGEELGESIAKGIAGGGECGFGNIVEGVGAIQISETPAEAETSPWVIRNVLDFVTEDGDTPLHLAMIHEHAVYLEYLLQYVRGSEYLNLQNDLGQTALHIAVIIRLPEFVKKLVEAGASLCVQENGGNTPLHIACKESRWDCAQMLLTPPPESHGPRDSEDFKKQLDCINYKGHTALHLAVLKKDVKMVQILLSAGVNINKQELSFGRSPLHLAVESQSPELVRCLLLGGADTRSQTYSGYTPLYSAIHYRSLQIPELLRVHGSEEPDSDWDESSLENDEDGYDDLMINGLSCMN